MATDSATLPPDLPLDTTNLTDSEFLAGLGRRVRELRDLRGMSRKRAASEAALSERHLAHLEAGEGNISIILLRRLAQALHVGLVDLFQAAATDTVEKRLIRRFLERLPAAQLEEVVFRLMRDLGQGQTRRRNRIALIGLRGAGKSTLGQLLAQGSGARFVELDHEIELDCGLAIAEIFALYGQAGYRRAEKRCLERVLRESAGADKHVVMAVGGGVVAQTETYELLLANCTTVWLKTSPEAHMARVLAQGDLRPMAGNAEAMDDLRRIMAVREPLYRKADAILDSGADDVATSLAKLKLLLQNLSGV